nr:hypothetical protein [Streptomyces sp. CHD11]
MKKRWRFCSMFSPVSACPTRAWSTPRGRCDQHYTDSSPLRAPTAPGYRATSREVFDTLIAGFQADLDYSSKE